MFICSLLISPMAHPGAPGLTATITVSEVVAGCQCKKDPLPASGYFSDWPTACAVTNQRHFLRDEWRFPGTSRTSACASARGYLARTKTTSNFCLATAW